MQFIDFEFSSHKLSFIGDDFVYRAANDCRVELLSVENSPETDCYAKVFEVCEKATSG